MKYFLLFLGIILIHFVFKIYFAYECGTLSSILETLKEKSLFVGALKGLFKSNKNHEE